MKNLIWVVLAAVVLGGGYMVYANNAAEKAAMAQAEADKAAEVAAAAAKVEEEAAAAAAKLEEEAAVAAKAEADAVAAAAEEAAAAEAAEPATAEAAEATETVAAATEEAAGGMADLLTPEGFNLDKVGEMIDGSELGALKKTALKTALDGAKDNPELLNGVLEQIKTALGM
ncbi:mucin-associated surface protein [Rhodobacteraceae bacterium HTCC2083]|jgi:colicin import membrane protein|nr:mucin-associated surface protein [Rhodobacteraceae bacterium HTCC2083]